MRRGFGALVKEQLKRIDDAIYRVERSIVIVSMLVMAVVVFLDVVHRTFASQESKFVAMCVKISQMAGSEIERGGSTYQAIDAAGPWILWPAAIALVYFGIRTANQAEQTPPARALMYSAAGVVAAFGLVKLMLRLAPNGFVFAQPLALVLTLWVGFVGASMCTHDNKHLKVEAVQRLIPERYKPYVRGLSHAATAIFCFVLLWLSLRITIFHYTDWVSTEGTGGLIEGLGAPKYLAFLSLPFAFGLMMLRFSVLSVAAFMGHVEEAASFNSLIEEAAPKSKPSDIVTEVSGVAEHGLAKGRPPSEIPTEAVRLERGDGSDPRDIMLKPSQVSTDRHRAAREAGAPRPASRQASGELGPAAEEEEEQQEARGEDDE